MLIVLRDNAGAGQKKEISMRYMKIHNITPARRKNGQATVVAEMAFSSDGEREALLMRAGLPGGSPVVPRLVFRLRTDGGLQAMSLSLDCRGVHGKVAPYGNVPGEVIRSVQAAVSPEEVGI